ncbi:MAG: hypothetical protein QM734_17385 [Cyclobacteriaceae bacterium]
MKKINSIIMAMLLIAMVACSEKHLEASSVPQIVKEAFAKKYPQATDVEWIQEAGGKVIYEAEFKLDGKEITAEFSESGEFLEEE